MSRRKRSSDWIDYAFLFVLIFVMIRFSRWLEPRFEDQLGSGLMSFIVVTLIVIVPISVISGFLYGKIRKRVDR